MWRGGQCRGVVYGGGGWYSDVVEGRSGVMDGRSGVGFLAFAA